MGRGALVGVILMGLGGCVEARPYLSRTTDIWAQNAAQTATPGLRIGVGLGALVAELCSLEADDWQVRIAAGVTPAQEVGDWLGLGDGVVERDEPTGLYSVVFADVSVVMAAGDDAQSVDLIIEATTPTALFEVTLGRTDDQAEDTGGMQDLLMSSMRTSECDTSERQVAALLEPSYQDWSLDFASSSEEALVWQEGTVLPAQGQIAWSGTTDVGRAVLDTDDASSIHDNLWPATASGEDWSADVEVALE